VFVRDDGADGNDRNDGDAHNAGEYKIRPYDGDDGNDIVENYVRQQRRGEPRVRPR
jgi:hypothetical protein